MGQDSVAGVGSNLIVASAIDCDSSKSSSQFDRPSLYGEQPKPKQNRTLSRRLKTSNLIHYLENIWEYILPGPHTD